MGVAQQRRTFYLIAALGCTLAGAVKLSEQPAAEEDPNCACIPWADAYAKYGAVCKRIGEEGCDKFFKRLPNELFCMNEAMSDGAPVKQWCHVNNKCSLHQNSYWRMSEKEHALGWKYCIPGKGEPTLGDKTVEELASWTKQHDLEIGYAVQYAYPTFKDKNLRGVVQYWNVTFPSNAPGHEAAAEPLSPRLQKILKAQADSGKPLFFTSRNGHPPFGVMENKKLYWVNFADHMHSRMANHSNVWLHPGEMNDVTCVAGCDASRVRAPSWNGANDVVNEANPFRANWMWDLVIAHQNDGPRHDLT